MKGQLLSCIALLLTQADAIDGKAKYLRENVVSAIDIEPETNAIRDTAGKLQEMANGLPDEVVAPAAEPAQNGEEPPQPASEPPTPAPDPENETGAQPSEPFVPPSPAETNES